MMAPRSLRCLTGLLGAAVALGFTSSATAQTELPSSAEASVTAAAAAVGDSGSFVTVPPSRFLDTRIGLGAAGPVAGNGTVHLQVAGRGGVPSSAVSAVVMNVTVTRAQASGSITVYPDGTSRPAAANLSFLGGQTVPNLVVVPVGSNGKVALTSTSSGTSQLFADVSGYYANGAGASPGSFTVLTPSRILDSRSGIGASGPVAGRGTVHLQVTGNGGVPSAGVSAVVMNVTVTQSRTSGYITACPDDMSLPSTSNLNFAAGQTVSNLVVVKLGSNGKVALTNGSSGTSQLFADVSGYYTTGSSSSPGAFTALRPSRILDSRSGNGASGPVAGRGTVHLQVTGRGGVPSTGVAAVVMNVTVTHPQASGYLTVHPDGSSLPTTSNLNFRSGQTVPNLVVVKVGSNGKVALTNGSNAAIHLLGDVAGYFLAGACTPSSVWADLAACGWPGPTNTGHPTGQVFSKTVTGGLVVTADNTVIDGWKISGGVQVRAKNVMIRNSLVSMSAGGVGGSGVVNLNPGSSATIERTTLDGLDATHACVWDEGTAMTVTAVDCSRVNDGIFMWTTQVGRDGAGDNFVIEDSWLHGFTTEAANGHVDGIQTEGAKHGAIRHNTVDVTQGQTSAIALWNGRKSTDDVVVERNLLSGGGFSVYAEDYSPSEASPAGGYSVTNVSFIDNVFSTVHYGCVGSYGVWYPRGAPTDGWRRSGNFVLETGQDVDNANPSYQGRTCN